MNNTEKLISKSMFNLYEKEIIKKPNVTEYCKHMNINRTSIYDFINHDYMSIKFYRRLKKSEIDLQIIPEDYLVNNVIKKELHRKKWNKTKENNVNTGKAETNSSI